MATVEVKQEKTVVLTLTENEAVHLITILNKSGNIEYDESNNINKDEVENTSQAVYDELEDAGFTPIGR